MANKEFILNLGKLVIGAAWTDGKLQPEEINALKELLFLLPEISGEEWMQLEIYMVSPVSAEERQNLVHQVLHGIRSTQDKQLAIATLENLMLMSSSDQDSSITPLEEIKQDIENQHTGLLAHLTGPIRQAIAFRSTHYQGQHSREARIEDFIKNSIYFQLVSELQAKGHPTQIPESHAKKICLAAGLMARVAWVDQEVCQSEQEAMQHALVEQWKVSKEEAQLIVDISHARVMKGLDLVRLATGFCECTSIEERKVFLRCLFAVANAANQTSYGEIEEIRGIAIALGLPHHEFIDAKLTIPREDRRGL
jgi:uncharacterized tellurite resistance protein B-like protein